jgi:hypothetical protein
MAACPASLSFSTAPFGRRPPRRRRFVLTQRRVEANRHNAARSTGPRTSTGKARVARNAIKHGFFVAPHRWTPEQQRDFESTYADLREDFRPSGVGEESCVWAIAHSYVRMASVLRYENVAALEYHQQCDRELNARIAAAESDEAARLREHREKLRRAGLWRPTIPAPREANALIRYMGRLERTIRSATTELEGLKAFRSGGRFCAAKARKQTHCSATPNNGPEALRGTPEQRFVVAHSTRAENQKTNPLRASVSNGPEALRRTSRATDDDIKIAKTKPLSAMFIGNRHARRRAAALAKRRP